MKQLHAFLFRLRALFRRGRIDAEMREEMEYHLERRAADEIASGVSTEDARRAAKRTFGNVGSLQEKARDLCAIGWLDRLERDVRFALRSLRRSPGFTATALLTLALGIGVNASAFSVLNALLLHVPPYPESDALVRLFRSTRDGQGGSHAPANFLDYRAQTTVFEQVAALQRTSINLGELGHPADRVLGLLVTPNYFSLLRVTPMLGRVFTSEEEQPGNNAVVLLTYRTWLQRFGGDPTVIDRTIRIDGAPLTVIGVLPPSFDDPLLWGEIALCRPLALAEKGRADRDNAYLTVIGRLKSGVTVAQAETAMNHLSRQLAETYPQTNRNLNLRIVSLGATVQDSTGRGITWLVAGLAGFVLLIACANLANLQLARNAARGREHAIRAALGASRGQLMRLVLTESLLLALLGGALALAFAAWTNGLVGRSFTFGDSRGLHIPLDHRVLSFAFVVVVFTGLGFGLLPAWLASRAKVSDVLKRGGRGVAGSRAQHGVRQALIVGEVALALVLLAGAGFFMRGLERHTERDPGWRPDGLVTAGISVRGQAFTTTAARNVFYRNLQERLAALPGVDHVAIGSELPTFGYDVGNSFVVEGRPPPEAGRGLQARIAAVTPGYFETLGLRLLHGRDFSPTDTNDSPPVVVINESMARQLWPGQSPVGKRIGGGAPFMSNPRQIIGVVSDVRAVGNLNNVEGRFQFYRALTQWNMGVARIALRSRLPPEVLERDVRRVVAEMDPDQAVFNVASVHQDIARGLASIKAASYALIGFAALGVLLAAVGIYGVVTYSVEQRTNEIGIRMALGAQVRDVLALIMGGGLRLSLIGSGLGLIGAFGIDRVLRSVSSEFSASGLGLVAMIALLLLLVTLFACWLPARRAARVNPVNSLRAE